MTLIINAFVSWMMGRGKIQWNDTISVQRLISFSILIFQMSTSTSTILVRLEPLNSMAPRSCGNSWALSLDLWLLKYFRAMFLFVLFNCQLQLCTLD
jgi:hypothetical protein